jgi:hypothetical protein
MRTLRSPVWKLLCAAAWLVSCAASKPLSESTQSYQPLVAFDAWTEVSRDEDPFITDVAAAPACASPGFHAEADQAWLELDTGLCNWMTVTANARAAVAEGEMLQVKLSHFDLNAPEPTEAQATLTFGVCDAWSKTIVIPSPAAVYADEVASPCPLRAGNPVLFHLHNHGQNTYQLQAVSSLR